MYATAWILIYHNITINLCYNYYIIVFCLSILYLAYPVLGNKVLDVDSGGVTRHLGRIADKMEKWKGRIAEELGLTRADIAAINTSYPTNLELQT